MTRPVRIFRFATALMGSTVLLAACAAESPGTPGTPNGTPASSSGDAATPSSGTASTPGAVATGEVDRTPTPIDDSAILRTDTPPVESRPAPGTGILATDATGSVATARRMTLTTYDDGRSCPAGCDSHVVFRSVHNGTANAFRPGTGADPFAIRSAAHLHKCTRGDPCVICFAPETSSCLITTYRGSGPKEGRFDVTPAFMREWCARAGLPAELKEKCTSHMRAAERLAAKVNCIANPDHSLCRATMTAAVAAKAEDEPRFERCVQIGERAYNNSISDPSLKRTHACAYFLNRRHPTGNWQLLAPGACQDGYFVGKNGLDCCSADPVQAAIDPTECGDFYR